MKKTLKQKQHRDISPTFRILPLKKNQGYSSYQWIRGELASKFPCLEAVHDKVGAGQMQQLKSIVPGSSEDVVFVVLVNSGAVGQAQDVSRCFEMFGSDEWGVPKVEVAQRWMVYKGKSQSKMDDDWGYP